MRVEIITYQNDLLGIMTLLINKPFDAFSPVNPCSLPLGFGVSSTCARLGKKNTAYAIANIFVVLITNADALKCDVIYRFSEELDWLLIHETTGDFSST